MSTGSISEGYIYPLAILSGSINIPTISPPETEERTVTPSLSVQEVIPSYGKLLSKVTVNKIPNNYGLITYNGFELTVS